MQRDGYHNGILSVEELEGARKSVIFMIQQECFESIEDSELSSLCPFMIMMDKNGLIRLRTKISDRNDIVDFCMRYVLPSNHEVVRRMIFEEHIKNGHVGVQSLMQILRENYWILKCRRTVRSVVRKCNTCRRYRGH